RFVQRHELRWEGLEVLDLPLRVWARVGLYSTVTQNFCGFGNGVTCERERARRTASEADLAPGTEAYDEHVRRYYLVRFIRPHADTLVRWRLVDAPHKLELMGGWRGALYIPGDFLQRGP